MGEVKDAVKGPGPKPKKKSVLGKKDKGPTDGKNLVDHFQALRDELSELTQKKDEDVLNEGDDEKAENMRKAALLRAVGSLLTSGQRILEDY